MLVIRGLFAYLSKVMMLPTVICKGMECLRGEKGGRWGEERGLIEESWRHDNEEGEEKEEDALVAYESNYKRTKKRRKG